MDSRDINLPTVPSAPNPVLEAPLTDGSLYYLIVPVVVMTFLLVGTFFLLKFGKCTLVTRVRERVAVHLHPHWAHHVEDPSSGV